MKKLILSLAFILAINIADACDVYVTSTDYNSSRCENGVIVYTTSTQGYTEVWGGGTVYYLPCGDPWTGTQPTSICC